MKKVSMMLIALIFVATVATSCRETKSTGEKIEGNVEDIGNDIEDAVDDN